MIMKLTLAGLATLGAIAATSASATTLPAPVVAAKSSGVELVQHNRRHQMRQWRRQHDGRNWRRRYVRRDRGVNVGELFIGTIAGAIIANAIREGYARDSDIEACADRYNSFDPETGTYIGYDGRTYVCPYLR